MILQWLCTRRAFHRMSNVQIASQEAILRDKRYRFELVFDGVEWVGLLLCWETTDFYLCGAFLYIP